MSATFVTFLQLSELGTTAENGDKFISHQVAARNLPLPLLRDFLVLPWPEMQEGRWRATSQYLRTLRSIPSQEAVGRLGGLELSLGIG